MTAIGEPAQELVDLVDAVCCGEISAAEMNRLMELTLADSQAMQYYVRAMHLHASLPRILQEGGVSQSAVADHLFSDGLFTDNARASAELSNDVPDASAVASSSLGVHDPLGLFSNAWRGLSDYVDEHPMTFSYIVASVLFVIIGLVASHIYVTVHSASAVAQNAVRGSLPAEKTAASASDSEKKTQENAGGQKAAHPIFVGRVTGELDCQWACKTGRLGDEETRRHANSITQSPSLPVSQSPRLVCFGDKLSIASGLLEITFDAGAKVVLEAPCTFTVQRNGGFLAVGRLTGRLDKKVGVGVKSGSGSDGQIPKSLNPQIPASSNPQTLIPNPFIVATPTAVITDLGTEFGVDVGRQGNTISHVFQGQIAVRMVASNGQAGEKLLLGANESVQVARMSKSEEPSFRRVPVDAAAFVRVEQFPKITKEMRLQRFVRWQAASEKLRRDPSLVAYYDFQRRDDSPGVLFNVAEHGGHALDGKIVRAKWRRGRMVGKQALEFDGRRSRVDIKLPEPCSDVSLAAWVYLESHENSISSLLMSNGWNRPNGVYWYFRSNAAIDEHLFFNVAGARGPWRFTPEFTWEQYDRWMHLAVVFDHSAKRVLFYKNGRLIDNFIPQGAAAARIGAARIGNWDEAGYTGPETDGGFCGCIDELAIFGRALRHEEIQAMFASTQLPPAAPIIAERSIVPQKTTTPLGNQAVATQK
jgi:hypothetical protein